VPRGFARDSPSNSPAAPVTALSVLGCSAAARYRGLVPTNYRRQPQGRRAPSARRVVTREAGRALFGSWGCLWVGFSAHFIGRCVLQPATDAGAQRDEASATGLVSHQHGRPTPCALRATDFLASHASSHHPPSIRETTPQHQNIASSLSYPHRQNPPALCIDETGTCRDLDELLREHRRAYSA
jgi:hypothetical protein